jgi:hypothetical protein
MLPRYIHPEFSSGPKHRPLWNRFWEKVEKTSSCWIWQAGTLNGYGVIKIDGCRVLCHRISWEMIHGPVPNSLCVLHNCPNGDNRCCVNPDHLFLGTKGDNSRDMVLKNRQAKGEQNGQSKLTDDQVMWIRRVYQRHSKEWGMCGIASKLGVTPQAIYLVLYRKSWRHLLKTTVDVVRKDGSKSRKTLGPVVQESNGVATYQVR